METKDINRIQDIKNKPSDKHTGLANKMSKLITNGEKAKGRYEASCIIFGTHHEITQIFLQRAAELGGMFGAPITRKVEVAATITTSKDRVIIAKVKKIEEIVITPVVNTIKRTQEDFPLSKRVKFGEDKGTVVSHDTDDKDLIWVLLDDQEKAIEINIYKLKFA